MDVRVVISIDFGTTYSGFAYAHKVNTEIITNDTWPDQIGPLKTNTVLQYDKNFKNVEEWGFPALAKKPKKSKGKSKNQNASKPIEHFKLHLGNMPDNEKPVMPKGINYRKAIVDYLKCMGKLIKETIGTRWPNVKFMDHVLIILTVPAGFSDQAKAIMRECIYEAGLINIKSSERLQFTTEPEAAAVYCMKVLKEHILDIVGTNFLIVDCGEQLEEDEWIIELKFEDVKRMFDPVINKIIKLIREQLNNSGTISAMFLVGGFSESKYLQKRIREEFSSKVKNSNISVPSQPVAAIVRGALEYGLNMKKIKSRRLPLSYGIELAPLWKPGDPPERRQTHDRIFKFRRLVEKGIEVDTDEEFGLELHPSYANQTELSIEVYSTTANEATYCDEPGMKKVGELRLDFPDPHLGFQRTIKFTLTFGQMEIRAYARNQQGKSTNAIFEFLI
ncbi:unnamed protein product [Rhizophagus irregularis]|uniref:Actin-like ATPase domain-containing protein n=1 Tax=Rhizophagus irregularis TaxID=588596 RepID=A0A915YN71_9GLOM|nr:unnamed protein product [Rhizophagus irregularis]